MVLSIKARANRKKGRVAITFEVDPATWANMIRSAKEGAHPDTLDYIAGRINLAFVDDEPLRESGTSKPEPDDGLPW